MSSSYIPVPLRREVENRANHQCEYCLTPSLFYPFSFHIDHIISEKQDGETESENLTYCCPNCNFHKGTDISAYLRDVKTIVDLFNPRQNTWNQHFKLIAGGTIKPLTNTGKGTIRLLKLNDPMKVSERKGLLAKGYPLLKT